MSGLRIILFAYGLINILGGGFGYMKAHSKWSLITGVVSGIVILYLTSQSEKKPAFAFRTLGMVVGVLTGFWFYRLIKVVLGGGAPVMPLLNLVLAMFVFGALAYSHFSAVNKARSGE